MSNEMGGMAQAVLEQEGELFEDYRAVARTRVAEYAIDEAEEQLFLDMLGLVA
jgi:hypothetical protein